MQDTDKLLVARFRSGEAEAFDRLMSSHMDQVFGLAWSVLYDREAALDATQEIFVKLHASLPRFGDAANLSAWLYRVCLNHCIDIRRKQHGNPCDLSEDEWEHLQGPESDDPMVCLQNVELRSAIRQAVDKLPDRQRAAFLLRHYQFMSLNEVSGAMGCSTGAVKSHLSRATARLRVELAGYVGSALEGSEL